MVRSAACRRAHATVTRRAADWTCRSAVRAGVMKTIGVVMKIAIEINVFGENISKVVEYPGTPSSQGEVIQWLMSQTDYKWADYEHAPQGDRLMYNYQEGTIN